MKLIPKFKLLAGCIILSLSSQAYAEYYFVESVREFNPPPCARASCYEPAPCARSYHKYKHKKHYDRVRSSASISINYYYGSRTCSVCGCGDAWTAAANEYTNCGGGVYAEPCNGTGCGGGNVYYSGSCGGNGCDSDDMNYDTDTGDNDFY